MVGSVFGHVFIRLQDQLFRNMGLNHGSRQSLPRKYGSVAFFQHYGLRFRCYHHLSSGPMGQSILSTDSLAVTNHDMARFGG